MPRVLLLFVDGVGLGPAAPGNPFHDRPTVTLRGLLGGPLTVESAGLAGEVVLTPLDACLGVEGLPQSATGQTALFTGCNAAALLGRHVAGFPGPHLRKLIEEHGLLRRAVERGFSTTFANAYVTASAEEFTSGRRRASVTTWSVLSAALHFRGVEELRRGRAVSWDICGDLFARRAREDDLVVSSAGAGRRLAAIAREHRLTVYETFLTDLAGHGRDEVTPAEAVDRLDGLLEGLLAARDGSTTLVLSSDHGNLEAPQSRSHTRNPVPLLAVGPDAGSFAGLRSILEVSPSILRLLDAGHEPAG